MVRLPQKFPHAFPAKLVSPKMVPRLFHIPVYLPCTAQLVTGTPVFDKTLYVVQGIPKEKPYLVGTGGVYKLFLKVGKKKGK
jgi:hypothetical protein